MVRAKPCVASDLFDSLNIALHRTPQAVVISECFGSSECYEGVINVWSEKFWLDAFSKLWSFFQISGGSLAFSHRAPVNWGR